MADAADLKSAARKGVRVRIPPSAPLIQYHKFRSAIHAEPVRKVESTLATGSAEAIRRRHYARTIRARSINIH